ncbi:hypothetical protein BY996DRAFT_6571085 [Phakopsora pachyrhizi]|nr:hypothetical protein BY996DRAFT_6571085 [Phakopsora pachyrhizi]
MMEARAKSVRYWDSRMAHRLRDPLVPGDMVLAYNKSLEDQWGKLFHNWWNGPYRVVEQAPGKSYVLEELDGTMTRRFAAAHIKRFYARRDRSRDKEEEEEGEEEGKKGLGEMVQARGGGTGRVRSEVGSPGVTEEMEGEKAVAGGEHGGRRRRSSAGGDGGPSSHQTRIGGENPMLAWLAGSTAAERPTLVGPEASLVVERASGLRVVVDPEPAEEDLAEVQGSCLNPEPEQRKKMEAPEPGWRLSACYIS